VGDQNLVRYDAGDQIIAAFLGSPKQIEMPDVKKVEAPGAYPMRIMLMAFLRRAEDLVLGRSRIQCAGERSAS